jgi:hypothetical protein
MHIPLEVLLINAGDDDDVESSGDGVLTMMMMMMIISINYNERYNKMHN